MKIWVGVAYYEDIFEGEAPILVAASTQAKAQSRIKAAIKRKRDTIEDKWFWETAERSVV